MPYLSPEQVPRPQQGGRADCKGDEAQDALPGGARCLVVAAMPWVGAFCAATPACPASGEGEGSRGRRELLLCRAQAWGPFSAAAPGVGPENSDDTHVDLSSELRKLRLTAEQPLCHSRGGVSPCLVVPQLISVLQVEGG